MKVTINESGDVLHDVPIDPEDPDKGMTSLRYFAGRSYEVEPEVGGFWRGMGWATAADESVKARDLEQPWDTREATDEDAEEIEREVLAPAREQQRVATIRQANTGTNEVWKGDPFEFPEGEAGQVVDAQTGEALTPESPEAREIRERAITLDVQDAVTRSKSTI